jgi:hypothetical protein
VDYNLTQTQKDLLKWLVQQAKAELLDEEFFVFSGLGGIRKINGYSGNEELPKFSGSALDALINEDLLGQSGNAYFLTGKGLEAVENNFNAPDTSFLRHLTPLADITNLDQELKDRCIRVLGAGNNDPKLWDTALRTAGAVLEDRIRSVGQIADFNITGQQLIGRVFGPTGTLAPKFTVPSELVSYRELFSGIYGTVRNPSAHRLLDQKPERAGATLMFINVLLELLEELR